LQQITVSTLNFSFIIRIQTRNQNTWRFTK